MISVAVILAAIICHVLAADKLKLSILVFRHGDRSPVYTIPNDIYNMDSSWPQGSGQLSAIGVASHIRNGKYFRARYMDPSISTYLAIDTNYKAAQVYVRSTDKDRTIMSAQSFLAGLFPRENDMTSPLDVWQPIPVHTVPKKLDAMLTGQPTMCSKFVKTFRKTVKRNPEFQSFMKNKTGISKKVIEVCGWPEQTDLFDTFREISFSTFDTLFCEKSHNYSMQREFVEADLFNLVVPYDEMDWRLYSMMTDNEKALCGGVLLRELKERIRASVEEQDGRKLVLFSAHDTTLASVLTVLGVFDYVHTPYATVLMLELWETEQDGFVVRLLRHHGNEELVTYTLPGCGDGGCSLEQFHSINEHLELSEEVYFKECSEDESDFLSVINKNVLFILLCFTILILLSSTFTFTLYINMLCTCSPGLGAEAQ